MLFKGWKLGPLEIKKVTGRFATKFAISLQVVSLHVKAFSQQFGKNTKKQTWWFVTFIARHRTPQDEATGYVSTGVNGESFASCRYETEFSSPPDLQCDDVSLGSLRQLEETAAGKRKRKSLHVLCSHPPQNVKKFSRLSGAVTAKKCTLKKRGARGKLLLCQSKPIPFLPFSLQLPSSLLKEES